jgi:hypothetical protein
MGQMSPVEYGQQRYEIAEKVGVSRSLLDLEYRERRKNAKDTEGGDVDFLREAEPWHKHVAGDELLTEIATAAAKHLVLPDGGAEIIALWSVFTHCHDWFDISPLLAFTSPTPECGKTTCLTFLAAISHRALSAANITAAALFRAVEKWKPTLLIDEADTFIRESDELRGIVNSGHQRGNAFVIRTVGDDHEPKRFRTWAPKAIALIGKLPPTLASRSIHIQLKRMRPGDSPSPLRIGRTEHLDPLARKAARWVMDYINDIATAEPKMPESLYARAADNWRPLFAIASVAGGHWLDLVVGIAERLSGRQEDYSVLLLHDVASMFISKGVDRLSSEEIVSALIEMEERPWSEWKNGRPMSAPQLAKQLGRFDIIPNGIRLPSGRTPRGYYFKSFSVPLSHYPIPQHADTPFQSATPQRALETKDFDTFQSATPKFDVALPVGEKPQKSNGCCGVAAENPQNGDLRGDRDPFAVLKDESLKLKPGLDDYPDLPASLDRRRTSDRS